MTTTRPLGLLSVALAVALSTVVALTLALLVVFTIGSVLAGDLADAPFLVVFFLVPASLGSVGAALALKRPENVVGWLLLVAGFLSGLSFACGEYERFAEAADRPDWPFVLLAGWMANTWFAPSIGLLVVLLPLLFPTGRLLGPRWRLVAVAGIGGVTLAAIASATAPGPLGGPGGPVNPFVPPEPIASWIQTANELSSVAAPPIFIAALASLLIRFRRSTGVERQQIKWLLFAAAITAAAFCLSILGIGGLSDAAWFTGLLSMSFLPVAIGFAILRYRLYDIDRILNRTLVYAALTISLIFAYLGGVISLQYAIRTITGGESQVAVVASTLAIAALFDPLRRRIQAFVDRRFYRSRYGAQKTLAAFSVRVRDETDLDALSGELVAVVRGTMQPTRVSLWLRPQDGHGERRT